MKSMFVSQRGEKAEEGAKDNEGLFGLGQDWGKWLTSAVVKLEGSDHEGRRERHKGEILMKKFSRDEMIKSLIA